MDWIYIAGTAVGGGVFLYLQHRLFARFLGAQAATLDPVREALVAALKEQQGQAALLVRRLEAIDLAVRESAGAVASRIEGALRAEFDMQTAVHKAQFGQLHAVAEGIQAAIGTAADRHDSALRALGPRLDLLKGELRTLATIANNVAGVRSAVREADESIKHFRAEAAHHWEEATAHWIAQRELAAQAQHLAEVLQGELATHRDAMGRYIEALEVRLRVATQPPDEPFVPTHNGALGIGLRGPNA